MYNAQSTAGLEARDSKIWQHVAAAARPDADRDVVKVPPSASQNSQIVACIGETDVRGPSSINSRAVLPCREHCIHLDILPLLVIVVKWFCQNLIPSKH